MSRYRLLALSSACALLTAGALAGCGRIGPLEQPAPLFGARAKADYAAQHQALAQAQAEANRQQQSDEGSAERQVQRESNTPPSTTNATGAANTANTLNNATDDDPNADDAPLTRRDVKDPGTLNTSPRDAPVPGAPNSMGPTPSVNPPN